MSATLPGYNDTCFVVGLDLAQKSDWTAIAILEVQVYISGAFIEAYPWAAQTGWRSPADMPIECTHATLGTDWSQPWPGRPPLVLKHLERIRGLAYPQVVDHVMGLLGKAPLGTYPTQLVLDQTGVGLPVFDLFKAAGAQPIGVSIHGGDRATCERRQWRTPKRDLASAVRVALESKRLLIPRSLPLASTLIDELQNFRVTIDPKTAHDSYSHWRENQHDDLVLATALAVWWRDRVHRTLDDRRQQPPAVGSFPADPFALAMPAARRGW